MSHIFISYSRKDFDFAQKIVDALAENKLDTWIDWKSIPKGEDWEQEIYRGIEEADAFLFLISPDSVASQMCNKEIAHAVKNGKRILPIVIRDTDPKIIHPEISKRNWIFCRDGQDDFNKAIEETRKTIHTDYEWLKYHTELQVKALKWEKKKDTSRLLRGKELREAEQQLAEVSVQEDPQPTQIQREYILVSQRNEIRTRRQITIGLVAGLAIMVVLSFVAWGQRNSAISAQNTAVAEANSRATAQANALSEANAKATALVNEESARATAESEKRRADKQSDIALANQMAAFSISHLDTQYDLSLLLASQSFQLENTYQTKNAFLFSLQQAPYLLAILQSRANDIIFTSDNLSLVSGYEYNNISFWDLKTHTIVKELEVDDVTSLSLSMDGNILAAGTSDGRILVLDLSTGKSLMTWRGEDYKIDKYSSVEFSDSFDQRIYDITFSPTTSLLASSSLVGVVGGGEHKNAVRLWDATTGQQIKMLINDYIGSIVSIAFSPDGTILAGGGSDKIIWLWDVNTGKQIGNPLTGHTDGITDILFSPDGKVLATVACDDGIYLWNVQTHKMIDTILDNVCAEKIAFNSDGSILAVGTISGEIWLWSMKTGEKVDVVLTGHTSWINKVLFSLDDSVLASESEDGTIRLWDINAIMRDQVPPDDTTYVLDLTFSPNGCILASGGSDNTVRLWDAETMQQIGEPLKGQSDRITKVVFNPNGNILASGSEDGTLWLWNVETHRQIDKIIGAHNGAIRTLSFSPDGTNLLSGSEDGSAWIWNLDAIEKGKELNGEQIMRGDWISSMVFSPDGLMFAIGTLQGSISFWNTTSHENAEILNDFDVNSLAFSHNGLLLAKGGVLDTIHLWNVKTQEEFGGYFSGGVISPIQDLAFSIDDSTIFSREEFVGNVLLWDVATGQQIGAPIIANRPGHLRAETYKCKKTNTNFISGGSILSPDGTVMIGWGTYSNFDLLDIDFNSWVKKACHIAGRNLTIKEWQMYYTPDRPYQVTCPGWPIPIDAQDSRNTP